jgi:alkylation response protein AidB-like acyl-CoA dehydrogenase
MTAAEHTPTGRAAGPATGQLPGPAAAQVLRARSRPAALLEAVHRLGPQLERAVEQSVANRNLVPSQANALFDAGLFWTQVPACLGGAEADAVETFEIFEALARLDGSLAWTVMAAANTTALMGVHLGDAAVAEIFADPRALSAGQVAPRGTAVREAGGVRVQGDFVFSSGSAHANWMMGGFRELDRDGRPVRLPNGLPSVLIGVVPKSDVEMDSEWEVLGLEATGSVNYRIPEQVIRPEFLWPLIGAEVLRGGPVYGLGPFGLACIAHAAFSVGVARRALDEVAELARGKRRAGRPVLVDDPVFQTDYGMAEAALGAARAGAVDALRTFEEAAAAGAIEAAHRGRARLATTHSSRTAVDVIGFAYRYAGSTGLRNGSVVQRCYRDISASEAHVLTDHSSWADAAAALLSGTAGSFL